MQTYLSFSCHRLFKICYNLHSLGKWNLNSLGKLHPDGTPRWHACHDLIVWDFCFRVINVCLNGQGRESSWARFHFAFLSAPLQLNNPCFSKHLHKYPRSTSWYSCVVGSALWSVAESQDRYSGPGLQVRKPVSDVPVPTKKCMIRGNGWAVIRPHVSLTVLLLHKGRIRSYVSQGGKAESVHFKSYIWFARQNYKFFQPSTWNETFSSYLSSPI